jgi:hypothetical protein
MITISKYRVYLPIFCDFVGDFFILPKKSLTALKILRGYGIEQRAKNVTDWRNGEYTTNDGILLSGYTPGSYVEFKVRTIGAEELKSDWSPVVGVWVA